MSRVLIIGAGAAGRVVAKKEFDARPFMKELNVQGLPWKVIDLDGPLDD